MEAYHKDEQSLSGKGELPPKKRTWDRVKPICNKAPQSEDVQSGSNSSELTKTSFGSSGQVKVRVDQGESSEACSLSPPLLAATSKRSIECKFCGQKFSTTQALGGHQNAHRKERDLEKAMAASQVFPPTPFMHGMLRTAPRSSRGPFPGNRFQYHPYNGYSQNGLARGSSGVGRDVGINHLVTSFASGLNAYSFGPMRRPNEPANFSPNVTGFIGAMDPHMESLGLNLGLNLKESAKMVLPSEIGEGSKLKSHVNQNESTELDLNLKL